MSQIVYDVQRAQQGERRRGCADEGRRSRCGATRPQHQARASRPRPSHNDTHHQARESSHLRPVMMPRCTCYRKASRSEVVVPATGLLSTCSGGHGSMRISRVRRGESGKKTGIGQGGRAGGDYIAGRAGWAAASRSTSTGGGARPKRAAGTNKQEGAAVQRVGRCGFPFAFQRSAEGESRALGNLGAMVTGGGARLLSAC